VNKRGRNWLVSFLISISILSGVLPACNAGKTTLKIVASFPMQGVATGASMVEAIELALAEINGQVPGVSIELVKLDNGNEKGQWNAGLEEANVRTAVNDPDVVAYIGPLSSGAAEVSIPIASRAELAQISPGATWPGLTKVGFIPGEPAKFYPTGQRTFYRTCPTDDAQALAAVRWAKELGFRTVYIIDDGEIQGKGQADLFEQRAQSAGLKVVGHETINKTSTNFMVTMSNLWHWKPDLVYFGGYAANGVIPLLKQMRTVKPAITAAFMGSDAIVDSVFLNEVGEQAEGVYVTLVGVPPDQLPKEAEEGKTPFVQAYEQKYGHPPKALAVYGYDAARAVIEAIKAAPTKDRAGVLEAIKTVKVDGASGEFRFDRNGDTTLVVVSANRVSNGQFKYISLLDTSQ